MQANQLQLKNGQFLSFEVGDHPRTDMPCIRKLIAAFDRLIL